MSAGSQNASQLATGDEKPRIAPAAQYSAAPESLTPIAGSGTMRTISLWPRQMRD